MQLCNAKHYLELTHTCEQANLISGYSSIKFKVDIHERAHFLLASE